MLKKIGAQPTESGISLKMKFITICNASRVFYDSIFYVLLNTIFFNSLLP